MNNFIYNVHNFKHSLLLYIQLKLLKKLSNLIKTVQNLISNFVYNLIYFIRVLRKFKKVVYF